MNKVSLIFLGIILFLVIGIFSYKVSFALFSDSATSTNNVFSAAQAFPTATPTPTPPIAQTLVINEVLPDSSCFQGQTEAQWLEIYNGFSTTVNLKNFKITDGTNTIDLVSAASVDVAPGGFVLLAHSTSIFGSNKCYQDNGTQVANLGGNLNIDVGHLQLLDSSSVVIDDVQWGGDTGLNPLQDQSIERDPTGRDTATGSSFNAADFVVKSPPTPGL